MKERLAFIRNRMTKDGVSAFYAWYDPKANFMIDTDDATEDILWMISEIERLRVENNDLKSPRVSEFVEKQLKRKLSGKKQIKLLKELKRRRSRE
jgi:hypothetical protein